MKVDVNEKGIQPSIGAAKVFGMRDVRLKNLGLYKTHNTLFDGSDVATKEMELGINEEELFCCMKEA